MNTRGRRPCCRYKCNAQEVDLSNADYKKTDVQAHQRIEGTAMLAPLAGESWTTAIKLQPPPNLPPRRVQAHDASSRPLCAAMTRTWHAPHQARRGGPCDRRCAASRASKAHVNGSSPPPAPAATEGALQGLVACGLSVSPCQIPSAAAHEVWY